MAIYSMVADVHVDVHRKCGGRLIAGLNRRAEQTLDVLKAARDIARKNRAQLTILGDLFDTTRPSPQVIAATARAVELTYAEHDHIPSTLIMMGNHDMVSSTPGDNALDVLYRVAYVIDEPTRGSMVPFQTGDARQWLPDAVADLKDHDGVLMLHLGIADDQTAEYLRESHDAVHVNLLRQLCKKHGISAVFAGNWHSHRRWGPLQGHTPDNPLIMQLGALVPTGWDNPGATGYGTVATYNTESRLCAVEFLDGPRFYKVSMDSDKLPPKNKLSYVQIVATPDKVDSANILLDQWRLSNDVCDGFVSIDATSARTAARVAASTARSASTLEEALAGYVKQMELPAGCAVEDVLASTRRYLGSV